MKKQNRRSSGGKVMVSGAVKKSVKRPHAVRVANGRGFPIVGIGASAGGLEALEQFLRNVPSGSGMSFVVIQHLDPTHKDIMSELLQRVTEMTVCQAKDRVRIRPDHVYVIPPNKYMSILSGTLHLFEPTLPRGQRLPIDFFFRSLAIERKERSIAVVLSGMGSDGTLGARMVKEKAGVVLVQDPSTAGYDSMPRSIVDAGLADYTVPAEELPQKIVNYLQYTPLFVRQEATLDTKTAGALEKAIILLRAQTGHDFSMYKKNTIYRRIERRMAIYQVDKIGDYVRFLQENPNELELLFKDLLIGVTSFFRDPRAWEQLKAQIAPLLISNRPVGQVLRAWVPGCSTGEEAYTLAMIFKEAVERFRLKGRFSLQVFATDLDKDAIDKARQGVFPANIAADVSSERLEKFFIQEGPGYRVCKEIRQMVIFAVQNIIMDPPFTKLDFLTCRNLLIYLSPELQKKLLPVFYYTLNPGGIMLLGSAETVDGFTNLFASIDDKAKLYQRNESAMHGEPQVEFPPSFIRPLPMVPSGMRMLRPGMGVNTTTDRFILQCYAPPAVLVNNKGEIIYISGRTGKYLEPAIGKASMNIFSMVRDGLRHELAIAFKKAVRQKGTVVLKNQRVGGNGYADTVNVTVQYIDEPESLKGMVIIVFAEVLQAGDKPRKAGLSGFPLSKHVKIREMDSEIIRLREKLQRAREEMHTSQEELTSTNEELQSTNEELQSTNEELMTSKEEMQSLNEELQTVNNELQSKLDEFSRANNDMKNLLNSTDIATVFLDNDLNVRSFTTQASKLIKLIPGDVGRPLADLSSSLIYSDLVEDAKEVLLTLAPTEKPIATTDGQWFVVRIIPYRTLENIIDGLVITFMNLTKHRLSPPTDLTPAAPDKEGRDVSSAKGQE